MTFVASKFEKKDLKTRKVTKKSRNPCVLRHALLCSFTHLSCRKNGDAGVSLRAVTHPGKLWELFLVLVCTSQQLSCGLSGGFRFGEALILFFFQELQRKSFLGR